MFAKLLTYMLVENTSARVPTAIVRTISPSKKLDAVPSVRNRKNVPGRSGFVHILTKKKSCLSIVGIV